MERNIFKPSTEELECAELRRKKRWEELEHKQYTKEQKLERLFLEKEVLESMFVLKERAYQWEQDYTDLKMM